MIPFFSVRNSIFNYYKVLSLIYRLGWIYNNEKLFTGKSKEFFTSHILHWKKYKPVRAWGRWLLFLSLECVLAGILSTYMLNLTNQLKQISI